jgi:hypothetical protein
VEGNAKMQYKNAIKLHNEDEIVLKEQLCKNETWTVLGHPQTIIGHKGKVFALINAISNYRQMRTFTHLEIK